jgi:propanol-preferring alcohol dehydrogenase
MKAAVLSAAGEAVRIVDVPRPEAAPGERLVRIRACGLCGTDVKLRAGKIPGVRLPLILGHEPAGVDVESGKRVVVYPHLSCGQCVNCVEGRENICLRTRGTMGITAPGVLAEYASAPERNLVELADRLDFEHGALAGGVIAVSLCAARKLGPVLDHWVIVTGMGGLGLVGVQLLHAAGARVVALSRSEEKRRLAERLGAVTGLDTDGAYEEQVRDLTGGAGAAAAMDFTGVGAQVARLVRCVRRGGRIVLVGYTSGALSLPYAETVMNGIDVMGSRSYTREDVRVALGLMERRKVDPLIGKTAHLEDVDRALDWIADASITGRVVATID